MRKLAAVLGFLAIVFAMAVLSELPALAGTCSLSDFPASGTLTADRLNQRLRQTESCVNGNIGNANINSAEPIAVSNLANPNAEYSQSFTIGLVGAAAPADITASTDMHMWRVPVTSTVTGMSVHLFGCTGCSVTVVLQKDASTIKTFAAIASTTTQTDYTLSNSVTNAQDLNIDVSGTITGVKAIDVVVYEKAQHQS